MSILNVNKINPVGGGSTITIAGIASVTNNISVGNSVTASSFHGDGSQLTGISVDSTKIETGNTKVETIDTGSDGHVKVTTEGSERVRITSGGSVLVGKTATSLTTDGIRMDSNAAMITASSTSTNQATANGGSLYLINSSATDNNFSHIGGYNSNGLVTSQINFVNTSHSSRTGDISFRTHDGSSMPERLRISSAGYVTTPYTVSFYADGMTGSSYNNGTMTGGVASAGHNIGNHYNTGTGIFTAPVAGRYLVGCGVLVQSGTGRLEGKIHKNNSSTVAIFNGTGTTYDGPTATTVVQLAANDNLRVTRMSGTAYSPNHGNHYFFAHLIG